MVQVVKPMIPVILPWCPLVWSTRCRTAGHSGTTRTTSRETGKTTRELSQHSTPSKISGRMFHYQFVASIHSITQKWNINHINCCIWLHCFTGYLTTFSQQADYQWAATIPYLRYSSNRLVLNLNLVNYVMIMLFCLLKYCLLVCLQEGIQPMWEDGRNRKGGRWIINLDKKRRQDLDCLWLELVSW